MCGSYTMRRLAALSAVVVICAMTASATVPTPDNVDLNLQPRPTLETLGGFEPMQPASGTIPEGLNGIIPAAGDVLPIILPGSTELCRINYTCLTAPTSCDTTLTGSETASEVNSLLADGGNGPVFCVPTGADFTAANFDIAINRDCTASRCYIVPTDIATRTANAAFTASPKMNSVFVGNAAHNWAFIGLDFDNTAKTNSGHSLEVGSANDVIVAHSVFHEWGSETTSLTRSALRLQSSVRPTVYSNIFHDSHLVPSANLSAVTYVSTTDAIIHRNTVYDVGGYALENLSAGSTGTKIVINHAYETGANRLGPTDSVPQGAGSRSCAPGGFAIRGTGGVVYGNLLHGFRPHRAECAGAQGTGEAMLLDTVSGGHDIYYNAVWDAYRGMGGGTAGVQTGSTISANLLELVDGSGGDSWDGFGIGTGDWGGDDQIYAFNSLVCASEPSGGIEIYRGSAADFDMRYNVFRGCSAPGTQTGSASLLNVYVDNGAAAHEPLAANCDGVPVTQSCDDSANAINYTNFAIWAEICEHRADPQACLVHTFEDIVPPEGGSLDNEFSSPTYTGGRGASTPKQKWGE